MSMRDGGCGMWDGGCAAGPAQLTSPHGGCSKPQPYCSLSACAGPGLGHPKSLCREPLPASSWLGFIAVQQLCIALAASALV